MPHGKPSKRAAIWGNIGSVRRARLRRILIERDGANCFHCGRPTRSGAAYNEPDQTTIDHWPIPKRELPKDQWLDPSRAVISCLECNRLKDHQTQVAAQEQPA